MFRFLFQDGCLVDVTPDGDYRSDNADSVATTVSAASASVPSAKTGEEDCEVLEAASAAPEKRVVDLRSGPEAVLQRMVGSDDWLLEKNPDGAVNDNVETSC